MLHFRELEKVAVAMHCNLRSHDVAAIVLRFKLTHTHTTIISGNRSEVIAI